MQSTTLSIIQPISLNGVIGYQKPYPAASAPTTSAFSFYLHNCYCRPMSSLGFSIAKFKHLQTIPASSSSSITAEAEAQENKSVVTLSELCLAHVPDDILRRMEELGYVFATDVQRQALPVLFSGHDCILHSQTGSGKTLAYLLLIHSVVNAQRSSVQALIVVPTRELGIQVTKVARVLAAKPEGSASDQKSCTVMALLDGGMLKRHKSWLKAEPPTIVVATIASLCRMVDKKIFPLYSVRVLVIDEVSSKSEKHETLLSLIQSDVPQSGIIFVGEQSQKSKKAGDAPSTSLVVDFLKASYKGGLEIILMEEDMNINSRAASLLEVRQGGSFLFVATDIAARGVDLPQTSHIYNFDLPKTAIDYIHRAGRTCRRPFSDERCIVTNIIVPEERFVLNRYENELKFICEELNL